MKSICDILSATFPFRYYLNQSGRGGNMREDGKSGGDDARSDRDRIKTYIKKADAKLNISFVLNMLASCGLPFPSCCV